MTAPARGRPWRLKALLALCVGLLLAAAAAFMLALQDEPAVPAAPALAPSDIERALQVLRRHDPRRQRPGEFRVLSLGERDLQLLLAHAASRLPGLRGQVSLKSGRALVMASVPAPWGGRWLNVQAELVPAPPGVAAERLRVGALPLPASWVWPLVRRWAEQRLALSDTGFVDAMLRRVELREGRVVVFYQWQDDSTTRLLAAVVPPEDQARLQAHGEHLIGLARTVPAGEPMPLNRLVASAFALAERRSGSEAEAVAENRAALITLTLYSLHLPLGRVAPAAPPWPPGSLRIVQLQGRDDLPLHWLISATLSAESGRPLADAVGAYKELADTRGGGSGFSFSDLLADRVGTELGRRAVNSPRPLQRRLARVTQESELLPAVSGLADNLSAEEFSRRFGGLGAPAYLEAMQDIERRVSATPVLGPGGPGG